MEPFSVIPDIMLSSLYRLRIAFEYVCVTAKVITVHDKSG